LCIGISLKILDVPCLSICHLILIDRNFVQGWGVASHVQMSPPRPPIPVKQEARKLAIIILIRMGPKFPIRFLIFCLEAKIFKLKVYIYALISSHNLKSIENFTKDYFLFKHLAKKIVFSNLISTEPLIF